MLFSHETVKSCAPTDAGRQTPKNRIASELGTKAREGRRAEEEPRETQDRRGPVEADRRQRPRGDVRDRAEARGLVEEEAVRSQGPYGHADEQENAEQTEFGHRWDATGRA